LAVVAARILDQRFTRRRIAELPELPSKSTKDFFLLIDGIEFAYVVFHHSVFKQMPNERSANP